MDDREGRVRGAGVALKACLGRLWVSKYPRVGRIGKHSILPGRASTKCPGLCKKVGVAAIQGTPPPTPRKVDVAMVRTGLHPTGLPGCGQVLRVYLFFHFI